jgi:hypothetical protein
VNVVSKTTSRPKRVHAIGEGSKYTTCGLPWYTMRDQREYDTTDPCRVCFADLLELHSLRELLRDAYSRSARANQKLEKARADLEEVTLAWEAERLRSCNLEETPIKLRMRRRFWPLARRIIK